MKIFKLKYLTATLLLIFLESCSSSDGLQETDTKVSTENTNFVMDPNVHYIVDGQLTNDKNYIVSSQKNAWNILHDLPKNRIVISTTPAEFEKTKNANLEFKKSFEEKPIENTEYKNPNAPIINIEKSFTVSSPESNLPLSSSSSISTQRGTGTFTPPADFDIAYYNSENDSDDAVLHIKYTAGGAGIVVYFNVDLYTSSNTTVNSTVQRASTQNADGFKVSDYSALRSSMFNISSNAYGFSTIMNHSKVKKTITLYANLNYGGNSETIILNPGQDKDIDVELKFAPSGTYQGARSIKVN